MTYTRTYTLEERALNAMCNHTTVELVASGVQGQVIELYASAVGDYRRLAIVDNAGRVHHADLLYGVVAYP